MLRVQIITPMVNKTTKMKIYPSGRIAGILARELAEEIRKRSAVGIVASPMGRKERYTPKAAKNVLAKWPYDGIKGQPDNIVTHDPSTRMKTKKKKRTKKAGIQIAFFKKKWMRKGFAHISGGMWDGLTVKLSRRSARLVFWRRSPGFFVRKTRSGKMAKGQVSNSLKAFVVYKGSKINPLQNTNEELGAMGESILHLWALSMSKAYANGLQWDGPKPGARLSPMARRILNKVPR